MPAEALEIKDKKIQVVKSQKYEEAAQLRDRERKIIEKLEYEKDKFDSRKDEERKEITEDMIYDVVSHMTKIPLSKLNADDKESLSDLESNLNSSVIGQEGAVKTIS